MRIPARSLVLATLFSLGSLVQSARAGEPGSGHHVRTLDSRIRAAIADGVERSALFRDLVAQLDASDVIVYAQPDCLMPERLLGRLTFMSQAGGRRYVMVRVACSLSGPSQIANAASVVDEESMAQEYRRIGFASGGLQRGAGYDSRAAIDAGHRVWSELSHAGNNRGE